MNTTLLWLFICLNIVNVIFQTVRSLATVKCGKVAAALINAITYFVYTIVLVYTVCELPLFLKASIVGICNLIGVFVVKLIEEKARKDKLWKVEATAPNDIGQRIISDAKTANMSFNYVEAGPYIIFNFYCPTQKDSILVKKALSGYPQVKYFVTESKVL